MVITREMDRGSVALFVITNGEIEKTVHTYQSITSAMNFFKKGMSFYSFTMNYDPSSAAKELGRGTNKNTVTNVGEFMDKTFATFFLKKLEELKENAKNDAIPYFTDYTSSNSPIKTPNGSMSVRDALTAVSNINNIIPRLIDNQIVKHGYYGRFETNSFTYVFRQFLEKYNEHGALDEYIDRDSPIEDKIKRLRELIVEITKKWHWSDFKEFLKGL